jgi:hypothetical protein
MQENRKVVLVKKVGTNMGREVDIFPGTTTADVLSEIGATEAMVLSPDPKEGKVFGSDEVLWSQIEDGQKLYAALPTPVGR